MAVSSGFFNSVSHDRQYNASHFGEFFDGIINDGVFTTVGDQFAVTPGTGMNVNVAAGKGWFKGTYILNDAPIVLSINAADPILRRIDAVVLDINTDSQVRRNTIIVVTGTAGSNPDKPTLIDTQRHKQYPLAYITVPAGSTEISSQNIEDCIASGETPTAEALLELSSRTKEELQGEIYTLEDTVTDQQVSVGNVLTLNDGNYEEQYGYEIWDDGTISVVEDTSTSTYSNITHINGLSLPKGKYTFIISDTVTEGTDTFIDCIFYSLVGHTTGDPISAHGKTITTDGYPVALFFKTGMLSSGNKVRVMLVKGDISPSDYKLFSGYEYNYQMSNYNLKKKSEAIVPILKGGTGNTSGYIQTGRKFGAGIGSSATAEGERVTATGARSHAEGDGTTASGLESHAEGNSTVASALASHAEGTASTASGNDSHAEGLYTTASGSGSHAEGSASTASGNYSHAEGLATTASGAYSHSEGNGASASGDYSHATGYYTTANYMQTVVGILNVEKGLLDGYESNSGYFIVGCGTIDGTRASCFRATETNTYGKTYSTSGADYAEMFEWEDENLYNEDRVGKFVTLDGNKIRLATSSDSYILGVVSGNASVIGDVHDDQWQGMFETDIYGRPIYEKVKVDAVYDEDGNEIIAEHYDDCLKVNKTYDSSKSYIPRSERPEWSAIGLVGKLVCLDDGTASVNDFVSVTDYSIATKSDSVTKFRVMERIDSTHIRIMIL